MTARPVRGARPGPVVACVRRGARQGGWLGIFGSLHVVEDPVGSRPVRSSESGGLGRFWDTFIAPNKIEFEVVNDWIDGFDVVRDVTIVTTLRPGVVVRTPAHLLYETAYEDGVLKVRRMAAHWEPRPVYRQLMKPTRAHLARRSASSPTCSGSSAWYRRCSSSARLATSGGGASGQGSGLELARCLEGHRVGQDGDGDVRDRRSAGGACVSTARYVSATWRSQSGIWPNRSPAGSTAWRIRRESSTAAWRCLTASR